MSTTTSKPAADSKKVLITSRVHPEIKMAALIAADTECRSIGSLVEKLLKDYLKQRGYVR
ncbi:MAG TPA: hypothetical protein VIL72_03490 [Beijerinckiaceae bacterium]